MNEYNLRVGRLHQHGEVVGHILVEEMGAWTELGRLWWKSWGPTTQYADIYLTLHGEFCELFFQPEQLDEAIPDWERGSSRS